MRKLGFLINMLILFLAGSTMANHSTDFSWMGYCCGSRDCLRINVSIINFGEKETEVLVGEKILRLNNSSVKESADGHTYWCRFNGPTKITVENTRCVFYTIGI